MVVCNASNRKSRRKIELEVLMLLMIQSAQQWNLYYQSLRFTSDLGKSEEIFQNHKLFCFHLTFRISFQFDYSVFFLKISHECDEQQTKWYGVQFFGHLLSH